MNQVWTDQEKLFIKQNAHILTDKQGAEQLSRITGRKISIHAWRKQRQKIIILTVLQTRIYLPTQ